MGITLPGADVLTGIFWSGMSDAKDKREYGRRCEVKQERLKECIRKNV